MNTDSRDDSPKTAARHCKAPRSGQQQQPRGVWWAASARKGCVIGSAVEQLCDEFAAPLPSPCGGSAAAVVAAVAASLVIMIGRGSPDWPEGEGAAAAAVSLREQLLLLAEMDVEAVEAVILAAREQRAGLGETDLVPALLRACEVPLAVAEHAAEVAVLARSAGREGRQPMRADADAAASLASASTEVAAAIVTANLAAAQLLDSDPEVLRLREAARAASLRATTL